MDSLFSRFVSEDAQLDDVDSTAWTDTMARNIEQWPASRSVLNVKKEVRKGSVNSKRKKLWLTVCGGGAFLEKQSQYYSETLQAMYGKRAENSTQTIDGQTADGWADRQTGR